LAKLPGVGDLFAYRDDDTNKSELVIFLRPVVIKTASVKKDLQNYSHYLQP
jgi:general secretion pathway protein D